MKTPEPTQCRRGCDATRASDHPFRAHPGPRPATARTSAVSAFWGLPGMQPAPAFDRAALQHDPRGFDSRSCRVSHERGRTVATCWGSAVCCHRRPGEAALCRVRRGIRPPRPARSARVGSHPAWLGLQCARASPGQAYPAFESLRGTVRSAGRLPHRERRPCAGLQVWLSRIRPMVSGRNTCIFRSKWKGSPDREPNAYHNLILLS